MNQLEKKEFSLGTKSKFIFNKKSRMRGNHGINYNSVRTQMVRTMKKQYPPDVKTFDEIPDESDYFKTERKEDFMIFKNSDIVIFQSPFQANIYSKYLSSSSRGFHMAGSAVFLMDGLLIRWIG